jgi:hypothetical protein
LLPTAGLKNPVPTVKSEGFVLAKNAGNDDYVRRAAATAPIAKPPIRPIKSTSVRYPRTRRRNVAQNLNQATRNTPLTGTRRLAVAAARPHRPPRVSSVLIAV